MFDDGRGKFSGNCDRIRCHNHSELGGFDRLREMSKTAQAALPFSPFYAISRDGIDRLMDFVAHDSFTFIVEGEHHASTFAEAISLSPIVHESLRSNPLHTAFVFRGTSIKSATFRDFLDFARSRDCVSLSRDGVLSFVSISGQLGNDRLALALLSSLGPDCETDGAPLSSSKALHSVSDFPTGGRDGYFDSAAVDRCAAKFSSYSTDELRSLGGRTLHRLLSSDCLVVESEDALLRLLLDLDVNRCDFFGYIEVSFLSMEGLGIFLREVTFDDLCESIWSKVVCRLKGESSDELRARRYRRLLESAILPRIPRCLEDFEEKRWTLLYRGSRDGFAASNFHRKCDGRSHTLTIIETTKGFVFGGFTPVVWDSSNSYKADNTRRTFVFTAKNPRGSEGRKFLLANPTYAIYCGSGCGPTFGNGHDIVVGNACNANSGSSTKLGTAFTNDTGVDDTQVLAGERFFMVKEIEAFLIEFVNRAMPSSRKTFVEEQSMIVE
jgi:hypothetical protein